MYLILPRLVTGDQPYWQVPSDIHRSTEDREMSVRSDAFVNFTKLLIA